jgi:hypothetical protein
MEDGEEAKNSNMELRDTARVEGGRNCLEIESSTGIWYYYRNVYYQSGQLCNKR